MIETQTHIIRHFENRDLQLAASLSKQTTSGVIDIVGATNGVFNNNLFYSFETKENGVLEGIISICDIDYRSKHAVVVCTPNKMHYQPTLDALAAGKHVLVEKPAFNALEEFEALWPRLKAAKTTVMVAENLHFAPYQRRLRPNGAPSLKTR